ncbi:MAG: hypothetical protein MJ222_01910 [Bacilli bacterium]|nr:hypothetical protein [Bacilli bacterium]
MAKTEEKQLVVERETYKKGDEERFSYFVKGVLRGKEIKAYLQPKDVGGYQLLDIVFLTEKTAKLVAVPFEVKDENGNIVKGNTFEAQNTDENGKVYSCPLVPHNPSDKAILKLLTE